MIRIVNAIAFSAGALSAVVAVFQFWMERDERRIGRIALALSVVEDCEKAVSSRTYREWMEPMCPKLERDLFDLVDSYIDTDGSGYADGPMEQWKR